MSAPLPIVDLWVIHPALLPPDRDRARLLTGATLRNPNWQRNLPLRLHHASVAALAEDAQVLQRHALRLLHQHGPARDLEILLIPCAATPDTELRQGIHAEWLPSAGDDDQIRLLWANTDREALSRVLTHEVGHHLRSFRGDHQRYPLTYRLLHEGAAERLVLETHGADALHHQHPCDPVVRDRLERWLRLEALGTPPQLNSADRDETYDADLLAGFLEGAELYPPATHLMLRNGLRAAELFDITEAAYLQHILPLVGGLP